MRLSHRLNFYIIHHIIDEKMKNKKMPKLKTRKAAKKRYKQIQNKKFMRRKAFKGHLLEKKSSKRKRDLTKTCVVSRPDTKAIREMLKI